MLLSPVFHCQPVSQGLLLVIPPTHVHYGIVSITSASLPFGRSAHRRGVKRQTFNSHRVIRVIYGGLFKANDYPAFHTL
ncbi:hypothetical protein FS592_23445 [Serratia plymuthica]|jgi:hypothetical protein|uniref:hypothetical protein n=1 Tax=Serratia plymuthica TaxID=82996 RepID=UPI0012FE63DE|nr:hypothetical protein [Serratia plymuthica]MBL3524307.1 hypothetical protein [Serratia plymuthica]UJE01372.1 hypothetical protein FS592_23445 [Serratia plymuthica]